jgi:hypothetical protein
MNGIVVDLAELHKKHLLPGFDDRTDEEHAVEIITADITKVISILLFVSRLIYI